MLTTILPLLLTAAYIAKAYNPENLLKIFGQPYIFRFADIGGKPVVVSAFFWFVIALLLVHILWFIGGRVYKQYRK
jgi:hypothetical protein